MKPVCDRSCPDLVTTTYLLERNNISASSNVFGMSSQDIQMCLTYLDKASGKFVVIADQKDTSRLATMLTYCSICQNWRNSQLHCTVYNLKFLQYLEATKKSWSGRETDSLEFQKIFIKTAKVLIISNIDFVTFKNFECQNLLEIMQSRSENHDLTTIIVAPQLSSLVGEGQFFNTLSTMLRVHSL